ncbi:MAG: hypothetical protein IJ058_07690 [Lachnospiraceae bacterium]|nr:hypothetical protein [Lachnospiraceae bacterium]
MSVDTNALSSKNMVVGFDLGRYSVQISFWRPGMEEPKTAELVTGSELYNIPMVLCKRRGVNQWFYGRDAIKYHENGDGIIVDNLLQKAIDGETEVIDGNEVDGIALLTLFIKRSLSILGGAGTANITDIMFTCEELGTDVIEVMSRVTTGLQLKKCNVYFQNYSESIYHYMIHQDESIWKHNVLCSHYDGRYVVNYVFHRNLKTTPIVTFVDAGEKTELPMPQIVSEDAREAAYDRLDRQFTESVENILGGGDFFSGIYLLGDGFKDEWYTGSVRMMARNRRIFLGNDMFSRGACFSMVDKYLKEGEVSKHIYLGADKLRSNVGMNVLRRGRESYLALLDAGVNWYDLKCEHELFLSEDHILRFVIIPLDGGAHTTREFALPGVPERDEDTLRVRLRMHMSDLETVMIHVEDVGFGELFPATGMEWDLTLEL